MWSVKLPKEYKNSIVTGGNNDNYGQLSLQLKDSNEGRTIIGKQFYTLPLQIFPPSYQDGDGTAFLYILNPTGGVLQHDKYDIKIMMGKNTRALITTPSANKIYKMDEGYAQQETCFDISEGAVLEYLPDSTILYGGSKYFQKTSFNIAEGATLITWDIVVPGRIAMGECFQYDFYHSELDIVVNGNPIALERVDMRPKEQPIVGLGLMEDYVLQANVYVYSESLPKDIHIIEHNLLENFDQLRAGVTSPCENLLVIRILANKAWYLQEALFDVWDSLRKKILGKPAVPIRR